MMKVSFFFVLVAFASTANSIKLFVCDPVCVAPDACIFDKVPSNIFSLPLPPYPGKCGTAYDFGSKLSKFKDILKSVNIDPADIVGLVDKVLDIADDIITSGQLGRIDLPILNKITLDGAKTFLLAAKEGNIASLASIVVNQLEAIGGIGRISSLFLEGGLTLNIKDLILNNGNLLKVFSDGFFDELQIDQLNVDVNSVLNFFGEGRLTLPQAGQGSVFGSIVAAGFASIQGDFSLTSFAITAFEALLPIVKVELDRFLDAHNIDGVGAIIQLITRGQLHFLLPDSIVQSDIIIGEGRMTISANGFSSSGVLELLGALKPLASLYIDKLVTIAPVFGEIKACLPGNIIEWTLPYDFLSAVRTAIFVYNNAPELKRVAGCIVRVTDSGGVIRDLVSNVPANVLTGGRRLMYQPGDGEGCAVWENNELVYDPNAPCGAASGVFPVVGLVAVLFVSLQTFWF